MAISSNLMLKTLQALDPVRIGEINLLLDALSHGPRQRELTYRVICGMAAKCDHMLQPASYITLGTELKLVSESQSRLSLTRLGRLLLAKATWPPHDRLTDTQIEVMTPELLGHPSVIQHVVSVTRLMQWMPNSSLFLYPRFLRVSPEQHLALKLLQVTRFAALGGDYISITKQDYDRLDSLLGNIIPRSEEALWDSLTETRLRAQAAEEFIVKYEQRRLKAALRRDLSRLVDRVSATDVDAGYDVRSFETNGDLRYIEVKSSTSCHVSFYWSSAQRDFAATHRDSYWVYFVPRSQELPRLRHEITLIKDPVALEGKYLDLEPSTYRVWLTADAADFSRISNGPTQTRMIA